MTVDPLKSLDELHWFTTTRVLIYRFDYSKGSFSTLDVFLLLVQEKTGYFLFPKGC